MERKTVTNKITELINVEGRKFHIKFSDADMKFEIIEFKMKKKAWYSDKKTEYQELIYSGNGEMFQEITKQILYSLDGAFKQKKEFAESKLLGINSFKFILNNIVPEANSNNKN